MRRESKKASAIRRKYTPTRNEYKLNADRCQACKKNEACHVHEISRGPARQPSVGDRASWLALCPFCHGAMDDLEVWPIARQLALKLMVDPLFFDPKKVNVLRGRQPDTITLADIVKYLQFKKAIWD